MSDAAVLLEVQNAPHRFLFWCPGCGCCHHLNTKRWAWNGDRVRPTASPSFLVRTPWHGERPADAPPERCHFFMRAGSLQFLSDSTHELAGQTVPMVAPP